MGEGESRYEAVIAPDGRVERLTERSPEGAVRPILPESREGLRILAAGRDILFRFDEERRLRNLSYPTVLEAMRQEVYLTIHKVRHGELLDEPDLVPALRRLLLDLEAAAAAFQRSWEAVRAEG